MTWLSYIGPGGPMTFHPSGLVIALLVFAPVMSVFLTVVMRELARRRSVWATVLLGCMVHLSIVVGLMWFEENAGYLSWYELSPFLGFGLWPVWLAILIAPIYGLACLLTFSVADLRLTPVRWQLGRALRAVALLLGTPVGVVVACVAGLPVPFLIFAVLTGVAFVAFALDEIIALESQARRVPVPVRVMRD